MKKGPLQKEADLGCWWVISKDTRRKDWSTRSTDNILPARIAGPEQCCQQGAMKKDVWTGVCPCSTLYFQSPGIVIIRKEAKPMPLSMSTQCQSVTQGSHPPNKPRYTRAMHPHTRNVLQGQFITMQLQASDTHRS